MDPKTSLRNAYVTASLLGQLLVFEWVGNPVVGAARWPPHGQPVRRPRKVPRRGLGRLIDRASLLLLGGDVPFLEEFNHLAPNDPWFHRLRDAYIWSRGGVDWKRLSKSRYGSAGLRMQSHGLGSGMHFHPRRGPISIECSRSLCGGRSLRRATGPVARTRSVVGFAPSESGMRFVAIRNQYPEGCPSAVTWLTARSNERVKAAAD